MSRSSFSRAVGNRLRFHAAEKDITDAELADALAVGVFTVQRHMRGDTLPGLEQIVRYAELLGTTPDDLLPRLDSNQQPTGYWPDDPDGLARIAELLGSPVAA